LKLYDCQQKDVDNRRPPVSDLNAEKTKLIG